MHVPAVIHAPASIVIKSGLIVSILTPSPIKHGPLITTPPNEEDATF